MDETCSATGEKRVACKVLVGKPEEKRPLRNPSVVSRTILKRIFRTWDGGTEWIYLAQDRDR